MSEVSQVILSSDYSSPNRRQDERPRRQSVDALRLALEPEFKQWRENGSQIRFRGEQAHDADKASFIAIDQRVLLQYRALHIDRDGALSPCDDRVEREVGKLKAIIRMSLF